MSLTRRDGLLIMLNTRSIGVNWGLLSSQEPQPGVTVVTRGDELLIMLNQVLGTNEAVGPVKRTTHPYF